VVRCCHGKATEVPLCRAARLKIDKALSSFQGHIFEYVTLRLGAVVFLTRPPVWLKVLWLCGRNGQPLEAQKTTPN
jgi:hypothetical protein